MNDFEINWETPFRVTMFVCIAALVIVSIAVVVVENRREAQAEAQAAYEACVRNSTFGWGWGC